LGAVLLFLLKPSNFSTEDYSRDTNFSDINTPFNTTSNKDSINDSTLMSSSVNDDDVYTYISNQAIWIASENGGKPKKLIWSENDHDIHGDLLKWSPNGKMLIFITDSGTHIYNSEDKQIYKITNKASLQKGVWSEDSRYFAYISREFYENNGRLSVYDTHTQDTIDINPLPDHRIQELVDWDKDNNVYIGFTKCLQPGICNSFIGQININDKVITKRLIEFDLDKDDPKTQIGGFLYDDVHQQLLYSGGLTSINGILLNEIFKHDLTNSTVTKTDIAFMQDIFYEDWAAPSPDYRHYAYTECGHMGPCTSFLISLDTLQSEHINVQNDEYVHISDWVDNDNLLVMINSLDDSSLKKLNINNYGLSKIIETPDSIHAAAHRKIQ
jgi:hypothetical protein